MNKFTRAAYQIHKIHQNVETMWKSPCKPACKSTAKLTQTSTQPTPIVQILQNSRTFPHLSTDFPTTPASLYLINFIHYSTTPITITTNNLLIKD